VSQEQCPYYTLDLASRQPFGTGFNPEGSLLLGILPEQRDNQNFKLKWPVPFSPPLGGFKASTENVIPYVRLVHLLLQTSDFQALE